MAEVIIVRSQQEAGAIYAHCVANLIARKPDCVLGLATGSSPLAAYTELAKEIKERHLDVSHVCGFALDEYAGLDPSHPESYRSVITRTVVEPLGFTPELVHVPDGNLDTIEHAGQQYDAEIEAAGGVDVRILGIGTDGHIGFNEPGSSLASGTRIKTLTEQTREDNARFFDGNVDNVPTHCITQGIGTIMKARRILMVVSGGDKAEILEKCLFGPVVPEVPASALQLHPAVTVVCDAAAGARCRAHLA